MNICILSTRYPYRDNMVHVFVKKLVDEWAKMGHRCVVISPVSQSKILFRKERWQPYYEKQFVTNDVYVEVFRPRYWHVPIIKIKGISATRRLHQRTIEKAIKSQDIEFDVIYGHFFSIAVEGWRYAKNHGIPLFAATGESVLVSPAKPCDEFSVEKYRDDLCGVVAVSSKNRDEAVRMGIAIPEKTRVFPNGADLSLFSRLDKKECRRKLNLPQDKFIIICVGQFIERKGQKRILQAIDIIDNSDIKTVFIGKGEDNFSHPSILFKGTVPNTTLPYYLNACDLFVLPTLNEGCCNAVVEALAVGIPIVSSDLPFNYDVLNEKNSILVDPHDINQIADAISKVYSDGIFRDGLALESFKQGQQLAIEKRAESIMDFIKERMAVQNE